MVIWSVINQSSAEKLHRHSKRGRNEQKKALPLANMNTQTLLSKRRNRVLTRKLSTKLRAARYMRPIHLDHTCKLSSNTCVVAIRFHTLNTNRSVAFDTNAHLIIINCCHTAFAPCCHCCLCDTNLLPIK